MKNIFIISTHLKKCVLLLFLSGITSSIVSQESNTEKRLADTSSSRCVNTFTNKTVSVTTTVVGCNTLSVEKVTVTNKGNLTLKAPSDITINTAFEVSLGGVLSVVSEKAQQILFNYTYDVSGNRITRRSNPTALSMNAEILSTEEIYSEPEE